MFFITFAFIVVVCSYSVFYIFRKVGKPQVFGHGALLTYLLEKCQYLEQKYWPTWWAFNGHLMTLVRALIQWTPNDIGQSTDTTDTTCQIQKVCVFHILN